MILFCEDCSHRNILDNPRIRGNKIVFRCSSCNYLNTISAGVSDKKTASVSDIKQICMNTPGIIDFFIFHAEKGIYINGMPEILTREDIYTIGETLHDCLKICSSNLQDVTRMTLVLEGKNLLVQMLDSEYAVILTFDQFPITSAVIQLLDRLKKVRFE